MMPVAMASISWEPDAFVQAMNKRARPGMNNTNFINSSGLDEKQYSCALMCDYVQELMKHETIYPYLKIWTDSLRGGEFGLANTIN